MPRKAKATVSNVNLYCRNCLATFNGELRGKVIVCQGLRQHITRKPNCFAAYKADDLVGNRNQVNLHSSVVTSSREKRKITTTQPTNAPPAKRILLSELNPTFLEEHFGTLPMANTLGKGQTFADKSKMVRSAALYTPDIQKMNDLLCHGGTFFNHFSNNAIVADVKIENFVTSRTIIAVPNQIITDDAASLISSVAIGSLQGESAPAEDNDEESSLESDDNVDGSSVRGGNENDMNDDVSDDDSDLSTQRMGNIAGNFNGHNNTLLGDTINNGEHLQTFCEQAPLSHGAFFQPPKLLERWVEQQKRNTIIPSIAPDPFVIADLDLLCLQQKFGFSLSALTHHREKKQLNSIRRAMGITVDDSFKEVAINWLPNNNKRPIHVRDIFDAFYELLSNEELNGEGGCNLSFPSADNPFDHYPDELPKYVSELHHGYWYGETADEICTGPEDVLVSVIGYSDGVATDKHGLLNVTPFNITLGIFNTETRRRADAWTTILLYPDDNSEASVQKGTKPVHKVQNLHNCIKVAFRQLKELMDGHHAIPWRLQYAGKTWNVQLKFAFAYVIGDTEMHDKLCGRYGPRTEKIRSICRHCTIATDQLCEGGDTFEESILYTPEQLDPDTHDEAYFQSISHHPITNAFHDLYFGANKFNIHLATPGEMLHMLQKGAMTRVIEGFVQMWKDPTVEQDSITAVDNNYKSDILLDELDILAKLYGGYLSRQSDRDRPRTKFRTSLFKKSKKNGHEHAGVIMDLLVAILSNRGRQILAERKVDERWIENYVYLFELLLQLEQFMKLRHIKSKYLLDERRLGKAMDHVLYIIDNTIHRGEKSMGNNLVKNHQLLHIPHYSSRWGPPTAMDSGDSERNHKFEVKPHAKTTQRREYNFQGQFGTRWHEGRLVNTAVNRYRRVHDLFGGIDEDDSVSQTTIQLNGAHFDIGINDVGLPSMGWSDTLKRGRITYPQPVVDFICFSVLQKVNENTIHGRTEADITLHGSKEKFRCHPNFRSDSNSRIHVWYDWAMFRYETASGKTLILPGQIAAIVEVGNVKDPDRNGPPKVRTTILVSHTTYAVVRLFRAEPKLFRKSTLPGFWYTYSVKWGQLSNGFFLLPLTDIVDTAIVVPNVEEDPDVKARADGPLDGGFFVFPSRKQLGEDFIAVIKREQVDLEDISEGDSEGDSDTDEENGSKESAESGSHEDTDDESGEGSEDGLDSEEDTETDDDVETCIRVNYLSKLINKLDL